MKLRFYVLTTRNIMCLRRHFAVLPVKETTVVINTKNQRYKEQATEYCEEIGVEYFITESNGTPGKGKNSVQDIFRASKHEYCVQIDGDDMLTPYGVDYYKAVATKDNPPDALINLHTTSVKVPNEVTYQVSPEANTFEEKLLQIKKEYPMKSLEINEALGKEMRWKEDFDELKELSYKWNYVPNQTRNKTWAPRFIFWSKKLCEYWRFDEDLMVGEDTLATWWIRDKAYRGDINVEIVYDNEEFTYLYDNNRSGIMRPLSLSFDWDWIGRLVKAMKRDEVNFIAPVDYSLEKCEVDIPKDKQKQIHSIIKEYFL